MLANIKTLFNERAFLIAKQMTLARNLNHYYTSQNIPKRLQDYQSINHLQREITEKETTISKMTQIQKNLIASKTE